MPTKFLILLLISLDVIFVQTQSVNCTVEQITCGALCCTSDANCKAGDNNTFYCERFFLILFNELKRNDYGPLYVGITIFGLFIATYVFCLIFRKD